MKEKIDQLINQIKALEDELTEVLYEDKSGALYKIRGKKIEFEQAAKEAHRKLKTGLIHWLLSSRLQNIISAPIIYGIFPVWCIMDLAVSFYQATCFRLYGIQRVDRSRYIVIDRHRLAYLNIIEKANCVYCGYANGVIAYTREIAARTEQYWCPIKHAHRVLDAHRRYFDFMDYGIAENYQDNLDEIRKTLLSEAEPASKEKE